MGNRTQPIFSELKVLELSSVLAGPLAGSFFAELGAEVIKVENKRTEGDVTRKWKLSSEPEGLSSYYHSANWGKESIFLDFSDDQDLKRLLNLIKSADIVISNYLNKTKLKFNLTYDDFYKLNEKIILIELFAYDNEDQRPGFDVVMQAETGFMFMTGSEKGPPLKIPIAMIDLVASHQIKEAALIALLKRERFDEGSHIEVSLFQSGISALINQATNYLIAEVIPQKIGSKHPNIAPYGDVFYSLNQKPFVLAVGSDQQFLNLNSWVNFEPEMLELFLTNEQRIRHRDLLNEKLTNFFQQYSKQEIEERLKAQKVPYGFILSLDEVFQNPLARKMLIEHENGHKSVSNIAFNIKK